MTDIKICGLKEMAHIRLAASLGARFVGLVFYPKSPRAISPMQAQQLAAQAPDISKVGLFVNPSDAELQPFMRNKTLDMLQLHGDESPKRVAEIRALSGLPVIKALKLADPHDLEAVGPYEEIADWLLFDAKPPQGSQSLPGGNGFVFDWTLLKNRTFKRPWMLSGGLTPDNVAAALKVLSPAAVDVSSGVETAPGEKCPDKIRAFIQAVKKA